MKGNKKFLAVALPIAVVLPLLVVSYYIGPVSVWFWLGVGVTMFVMSRFRAKPAPPPVTPPDGWYTADGASKPLAEIERQ